MALIDDLIALRSANVALRLSLTTSPKPTYNVHGHSFSWTEYQKYLSEEYDKLCEQIARESPFEIVSQGTV